MRLERFSFGSIRIDDVTYGQDVVIDRGKTRKRRKKPSKPFRDIFGHTPLSVEEKIPWKCRRLVVARGVLRPAQALATPGGRTVTRRVDLPPAQGPRSRSRLRSPARG